MKKHTFWISLLGCMWMNCFAANMDQALDRPGQSIPFWRHDQVGNSGIEKPMRTIITKQEDFVQIWESIYANQQAKPKLPYVDFSKEIVVVLALGIKPSGGYAIRALEVIYAGNTIDITVASSSPGDNCAVTAALTSPVELIRMNVPTKPVRFVERTTTFNCER
jgi:hypothetical protein